MLRLSTLARDSFRNTSSGPSTVSSRIYPFRCRKVSYTVAKASHNTNRTHAWHFPRLMSTYLRVLRDTTRGLRKRGNATVGHHFVTVACDSRSVQSTMLSTLERDPSDREAHDCDVTSLAKRSRVSEPARVFTQTLRKVKKTASVDSQR